MLVKNGLLKILSEYLDPQYSIEMIIEILEGIDNILNHGRS